MVTPAAASGAYRLVQGLANQARSGQAAEEGSGLNFGALLKDVASSVTDAGRAAETKQMALTTGKGNVVDVVTAVAETEVALDTMVAFRDRVIQAYEEIMRMPI